MVQIPDLQVEQTFWQRGQLRLVGIDEVGRGCLSGPVVAAAVLLPAYCEPIPGVRDSKTLSAQRRQVLDQKIRQQAIAVGIGAASVAEINQVNILQATYLAMQRALQRIGGYDHLLIDGRPVPVFEPEHHTAIVEGDASSYAIACASIVAKVRRDRFMQHLARRYPGYGWEQNVGYGTKQHLAAITSLGVTPHHRRSFKPVQLALQL